MLLRKPACGWLVVGLGNPGERYEKTRHNVGFRTAALLARQTACPTPRLKLQGLTAQCELAGQRVLLVQPMTYMNESGRAVRALADYYKIPPQRIIVLFDDISLPVGRLRVRPAGSAGGHNGIKSIIAQLGSQDFPRVKIGVGAKPHPDYDLADWVLSSFSAQEETLLGPAIERAADAVREIIANGVPAAMNRFNGST